MNQAETLHHLLLAETRRRLFEEGFPRLKKCLGELTEDQIWYRPNENSNSMGNIALHLCGNLRQWVVSGLGKAPDTRQRQQEFDERGPIPYALLEQKLDETAKLVADTLDHISLEDLIHVHKVQGYDEHGLNILVHVVEHFSYHVGQAAYFVKAHNDMDIGFYAGQDLDVTT